MRNRLCMFRWRIFSYSLIFFSILFSQSSYSYQFDFEKDTLTLSSSGKDAEVILSETPKVWNNLSLAPGAYVAIMTAGTGVIKFYANTSNLLTSRQLMENNWQRFRNEFILITGIPLQADRPIYPETKIYYTFLVFVTTDRVSGGYKSFAVKFQYAPEPPPVSCNVFVNDMNFSKVSTLSQDKAIAEAYLSVKCTNPVDMTVKVNNGSDFTGENGRVRIEFTEPNITGCTDCSSNIRGVLTNNGLSPGSYRWSVPVTVNFD
ncbi:hypothetical protein Q5N30_05095 [Vibrio cholerae]|uniref:hypothetical protein n=1 Tax=Vibrio cholerae TaxID=666 RepID=UPI0029341A89|nr:hypothetical protein [Vibrio cholerae]MDV2305938.1 hypothetical protein [Vibrio cholerae]